VDLEKMMKIIDEAFEKERAEQKQMIVNELKEMKNE
jgi:hypothetical protein